MRNYIITRGPNSGNAIRKQVHILFQHPFKLFHNPWLDTAFEQQPQAGEGDVLDQHVDVEEEEDGRAAAHEESDDEPDATATAERLVPETNSRMARAVFPHLADIMPGAMLSASSPANCAALVQPKHATPA